MSLTDGRHELISSPDIIDKMHGGLRDLRRRHEHCPDTQVEEPAWIWGRTWYVATWSKLIKSRQVRSVKSHIHTSAPEPDHVMQDKSIDPRVNCPQQQHCSISRHPVHACAIQTSTVLLQKYLRQGKQQTNKQVILPIQVSLADK